MPAFSDYLLNAAQNVGLPGVYVGLVNNVTSVAYKTGPTTAAGLYSFTISPPEPGLYTVYNSPTGSGLPPGGDWVGTGETNYVVAPAGPDMGLRSLTLSPATPYNATAAAGHMDAIVGDWGGQLYHVKSSKNPSGAAVGKKGGQNVDDTTRIQGAINAAVAGSLQSDDAWGAAAFLDADQFNVTALTYNGHGFTLRGSGKESSILQQSSGATFIIAPTGSGFPYSRCLFEDFGVEGWFNASCLGGLDLRGSQRSTVNRVYFDGMPAGADGVRIAGQGAANTGDAMFCTVENSDFNPQNAVSVCIHLVIGAAGAGSHPDAFRSINNHVNGNSNTVFAKADAAANGSTGIGNPIFAFDRLEGCGTICDLACQGLQWYVGWVETLAGTQTWIIEAGPASYPSQNNNFYGGAGAVAAPNGFVFTDNSGGSTRWMTGPRASWWGHNTLALAGGVASLDPQFTDVWDLTLSASTTITIPNGFKGQRQTYRIKHDATANVYVGTWPANVKFAGGAFGTSKFGTNTANSLDCITIENDGTNWNEVSRALNLS